MVAAKNQIKQQRIMWLINQLEHAGIDAKLIKAGEVLELFNSAGNPPRVSFPEVYGLRHVAFRVEDATAAREALIHKGYAPQELRHDTFTGDAMFFVMDPDGLPVEIHE